MNTMIRKAQKQQNAEDIFLDYKKEGNLNDSNVSKISVEADEDGPKQEKKFEIGVADSSEEEETLFGGGAKKDDGGDKNAEAGIIIAEEPFDIIV